MLIIWEAVRYAYFSNTNFSAHVPWHMMVPYTSKIQFLEKNVVYML